MVEVAAERGKQSSSRISEEGAGWACAQTGTFAQLRPDRRGFSWLNLRTLWLSRNEILAGLFGDPSGQVRARWVEAQEARGIDQEFRIKPPVGGDFTFLLLGDTGEGDASQYAVVPGLLKIGEKTSFAVIASDVIYPTGSGNEYGDKFFRPYQAYDAPIYAIPGNHDWYDGLGGFMRVFCDAPPLKPKPDRGLRGLLWRKPETIDEAALAEARTLRGRPSQQASPPAAQPGPYWVIESDSLLVVGVDTGIRNVIDRAQTEWLRRVSRDPRPKILVTGKPIYTGNVYKPSRLEGGGTIDDIVRDPAHRYVAAIGGDVHNYQRYPVRLDDGRVIQYVVTGGGGAFMHATHIIGRVDVAGVHEDDFRCYPLRGDSLSFYSQLYAKRLRMRWLYLTPSEAACITSEHVGNEPVRTMAGPVRITQRMRWAARLLGAWPWPLRLPVDKVFHRFLSELSDWDTPPFFKQFLHVTVTGEELTLRCFGATGCLGQELDPPLEDEVRIPLTV